ncbi:MAG: hypothetical protein AB8B48_05180 [Pseudomonadales bacterium]
MNESESMFSIQTSGHDICISKSGFGLSAYKDGAPVINAMSSDVQFKGRKINIGKPENFRLDSSNNAVELSGWYSKPNNLWYLIRYTFRPGSPVIMMSFTITDRHDDHPTESSWDKDFWHKRVIQDWQFVIHTQSTHEKFSVEQVNRYSGGRNGKFPIIEAKSNTDSAHWNELFYPDGLFQISHSADEGKSHVRIYPRVEKTLGLSLQQRPLTFPYPSNDYVKIQVVKSNSIGSKKIVSNKFVDQRHADSKFPGSFDMGPDDYVELISTGREPGDRAIFSALKTVDTNGNKTLISAKRMPDSVIDSQHFSMAIKDFWKNYPILAEANNNEISWTAIREPTFLYGGAGLTVDFAISLDRSDTNAAAITEQLRTPPKAELPDWWHEMDGLPTEHSAYRKLMSNTQALMAKADIESGNWGWKHNGDYQIGRSYHDEKNRPVQDWGALQYDLTMGLLLSWINTKDPRVWNRAHAAVRNIADTQVAKFHPYVQKQSGAGYRKGVCPLDRSHWCQAPIPEFNYHSRSLLLFSHLTGESWPKEVARMLIDNSAYFTLTRTEWTVEHERISGWALRNLYYGEKLFGSEGTKYNSTPESGFAHMPTGSSYKDILNLLTTKIVEQIMVNGKMSGKQPVWGGQVIEGLIIAYESGMLEPGLKKKTLNAIRLAVKHVAEEQVYQQDGKWWIVYRKAQGQHSGDEPELRNLNTYGWFWVNSFAWAAQHADLDISDKTNSVMRWLLKEYESNYEVQTPRALSGLTAFPSYAIGTLEN